MQPWTRSQEQMEDGHLCDCDRPWGGGFGDVDSPQDNIIDPTFAEVTECETKSEYSLGCTDNEEGRKKLVQIWPSD
jgi:hypothetical protein